MLIVLILLIIFLIGSLYLNWNMTRKNEKLEDIVLSQKKFIDQIKSDIIQQGEHLQIIDNKGTFKSDDEIGWFFDSIKEMQTQLAQYINL
jgi:HAMP domain-containing protein